MKKAALIMFLTVAALALLPCLGAAAAEPSGLQMAIVPADAVWVLHLDMEKLASSALFKMLTEAGGGPDIQQKAGEFFEKFKMDPFKDLKAVTVFGRGEAGEEPVVAVSGNFDKAHLLGLLKADSSHKETPYGKYTLYSWQDKHFGVFVNDNLALITEKEEDIKSALDAVDGKAKNISSSPLVSRLQKESANAIAVGAVADVAGLTGERKGAAASHEKPAILAKMQSATGAISEIGEKLSLKIEIVAASVQVAKDIEQAVRGMIALVNLQFTDSDAQLLTQSINVKVDGERVRIDASYPTAKLMEIIKGRKAFVHGSLNNFQPFSY
jgi:hypothetical protein